MRALWVSATLRPTIRTHPGRNFMPMINAEDGCPINFEVEGRADAPVLMLCNSLGTNLHMWDDQAAAFASISGWCATTAAATANPARRKAPTPWTCLGRDALAVLDAAGVKKFNWCGLSMGGMVGQWMGANARDRVEKLVLSNTHYYYADKQPWHDRIKFARDNGLENFSARRWSAGSPRASAIARRRRSGMTEMFIATKPTASSAAARRCATWTSAPRRRPSPRRLWSSSAPRTRRRRRSTARRSQS